MSPIWSLYCIMAGTRKSHLGRDKSFTSTLLQQLKISARLGLARQFLECAQMQAPIGSRHQGLFMSEAGAYVLITRSIWKEVNHSVKSLQ